VRRAAGALTLLLAVLGGCGDGEDSTGTRPAPPSAGAAVQQFIHEGSDNSIQESGTEASASERRRAAEALHGFLDAGMRREWGSACRYLARGVAAEIAAATRVRSRFCPAVLAAYYAPISGQSLAEAAEAEVGSLRLGGGGGFLLYHGARGLDYAMPMVREGGDWRVGSMAASALL
jgi:hypothetical protein